MLTIGPKYLLSQTVGKKYRFVVRERQNFVKSCTVDHKTKVFVITYIGPILTYLVIALNIDGNSSPHISSDELFGIEA